MQILNIFHVLVAIALVGLVLIQKGQGATAGASFGAGASSTVFGSRGAGTFLTRATWVLAALFCAISLTMAVVVSRTVGAPETDLGIMGETTAEERAGEDTPDVPPGSELSVSADEAPESDLPAVEMEGTETAGDDVPAFEAPEGADAIEGSEVRESDELPADRSEAGGEDGAEEGNGAGSGPGR